jgi:hypothetical protein
MKRTTMKHTVMLTAAWGLFLAGCETKKQESAAAHSTAPPEVALDAYFTDQAPASPGQIGQLRNTAKPGDPVVLTGLVMGREQLFVEGRAAFILGDRTLLTPCDERPGDNCRTPWDTCCDSDEAKRDGVATIQLTGADGRVLKQSLKGANGLENLSVVTLSGTVDKASTPENFIVNATKLHVTKREVPQ